MIKIAYVINSVHHGGPGNVLRNMIRNIDKNIYSVTVVLLFEARNDKEIIDEFEEMGVKVIRFNYKNHLEFFIHGKKDLKGVVKENKFDIIHSHGILPDILNAGVKCKNTVSTIHCNIFEDYEQTYGKAKSLIMTRLQILALRKIRLPVCVAGTVQNSIEKYLKKTAVVHNGIEPIEYSQYPSREELSIPENATVYIYIGSLSKRKNIVWLINEFHKYRRDDEFLIIFGRVRIKEDLLEIKDENIKIMGFLSNAKAYMKIADFYVSASVSEGFSISVLEALDSGLGLFVSDIPSHKEVFEMADRLYLGETFNSSDFEEKLGELRRNKGKISPEKIKNFKDENLSAEKMTKEYMKIYDKLYKGNLN